jgi:Zn-dependent protease with chaperone function
MSFDSTITRVFDFELRLPGWVRPTFLIFIAVAMIAGAVAGLLHGLLQPLQRWGRLGTWVTWDLVILAYLATLAFFAPFSIRDPLVLWALGSTSALGALRPVLLDNRADDRPSPRTFDRLRQRAVLLAAPERMWAQTQGRIVAYEIGREALESGASGNPHPQSELRNLTREMRAQLIRARRSLELAVRDRGPGGVELMAAKAWIERLDRTNAGPPA